MDELKVLNLKESVTTTATNWEFVGSADTPSWHNTETGHRLVVRPSDATAAQHTLELGHTSQAIPWWPVTSVEFPAELIPKVEWFLSAPESQLASRECVVSVMETFWGDETTPKQSS